MAYAERRDLISGLEQVRGSRVLCYFLSDRQTHPEGLPGFSANLADEPHIFFIDQLRAIGPTRQLDLFLYTRGGATDSVWPLVSLLREYCERLTVIVPFRAHSAGTLICLGADEVIMTEAGELSPIDPTTGNQFNPIDPKTSIRAGISVEDVAAYFELSRERAGISQEPYRLEIFKELTQKIHPLALGNVQRVYMQIRQLARRLLGLHMEVETNAQRIEKIVRALTEEFYSHLHFISRREAVELLGDLVRPASVEEQKAIWPLFEAYAETLQLHMKFNLPDYMGDEQTRDVTAVGAFIESTERSHVHLTELRLIQRPNLPTNLQIQVPPGGALPFVPWATRTYEPGIQNVGWRVNDGSH